MLSYYVTFTWKVLQFWKLLSKNLISNILSIIMGLISVNRDIEKYTACNIDLEIIEETVWDIVEKKIIDKDFRVLNESCNFFFLHQILGDHVETLYIEKGIQSPQKSAQESIDDLKTTPLASLQCTSNLPNSIPTFNAIEAHLMPIKSYFMYQVYKHKNEISSFKTYVQQTNFKLTIKYSQALWIIIFWKQKSFF